MWNGKRFSEDKANKSVSYSCIFLTVQSFLMMNFWLWRIVGLDFKESYTLDDELSEVEE